MLILISAMNSVTIDYLAKKKGALHMSFTVLPRKYDGSTLDRALAQRALLLSAAGDKMQDFWLLNAPLVGLNPEATYAQDNPAWRRRLRTEIDVLVARDLYGLSRRELEYMLDPKAILGPDCDFETFGTLKRAEAREFGRFVSRDSILAIWTRSSL